MSLRYLDREPPLHIAHRGGALLYPENTLYAFEAAVAVHRTDAIETDVHLSADGQVVIFHDDTLERCTDAEGAVSARTAAELARVDAGFRFTADDGETFPFRGKGIGVPTLAEALRSWPDLPFNIELKSGDPKLIEAFVKLVRQLEATDRICCGSEHDAVGAALAEALPEATHFYPTGPGSQFILTALQGGQPPIDPRYTVLDMPAEYGGMPLITPPLIEAAAKAGRFVNVWTIDEATEMHRLLDAGVGGIMTDRPDRLRAVLDKRATP